MQSHFLTWIGEVVDARYEIKSTLAIGGMGVKGKRAAYADCSCFAYFFAYNESSTFLIKLKLFFADRY